MVTVKEDLEQGTDPGPTNLSYPIPGPPVYNHDAPEILDPSMYRSQPPPASLPPPAPPQGFIGTPDQQPLPQKQEEHLTVVIGRAKEHKSLCEAYILWFPLGFLGLHHFYLKRPEMGVLYIFTLGLCGVGWLIDAFRMPLLVKGANKKIDHPNEYQPLTITDAYVLWFPFGILGFHHYYLRQPGWGLLYTFTLGIFGIGWLVDLFRIPCMVRSANIRLEREHQNKTPRHAYLCDAYALGATPLGILGAHHFYMGRHYYGLFYLFTLGGCGIGWITDWFRMKVLVDRVNNPGRNPLGKRHKYLDDAYVLAFPLGFLGTHHFYLERPAWGVLYIFTLGLGGIGWLIDLIRMPCLVKETNKHLEEELGVIEEIRQQIGSAHCRIDTRDITVQPGGGGPTPIASAAAVTMPSQQQVTMGAGVHNQGWAGPLPVTHIMAPPPYVAAVGGYSNFGHVYTVPAPAYLFPAPQGYPQGPSAPPYLVGPPAPIHGQAPGAYSSQPGEITGGVENKGYGVDE